MGKASSSKKVQRAARAAASSRGTGETRERGFPILVGVIVLLGIGLVFAARETRDPVTSPLLTDHWHSAYEVYDCGTALPAIVNTNDPDGIHTHSDGLMHIHPFNSSATGTDASLGVFFDASGLSVTESGIESGEYAPIDGTSGCGDEESVIKVARWNVDGPDGLEIETVYTSDFGDIRFLSDREAFTMAKVPVDEDPPPPSATVLAQLDTSTGSSNLEVEPGLELPDLDEGTDDGTVDESTEDTGDETVPDEPTEDSPPADTETDGGEGDTDG